MPSLLTGADATDIAQLRVDAWDTSFALAQPQTRLVLNRGGVEIDQQDVVVDWMDRRSSRPAGGAEAMTETQADAVFRRPQVYGFDVAKKDRFRLVDVSGEATRATGIITRVYENRGLVFAESTLDVGSV